MDKKFDKKLQEELRSRYVNDIIKNKPAAIVDFVCPASFKYRFSSYYLRKYSFIKDITDKYYEDPVSFPVTVSAFFGEGVMPWHHSFAKNLKAGSIRIYIRKKNRQSMILSAGIAEAWNRIMQAGYDRYSGMAGSADCALRPEQGSLS